MVNELAASFIPYLPVELREISWRAFPRDGKLLLFDRDSGLNVLMEGNETCHVQQIAPRTLLIAVTNACNRTCSFCYRDRKASSLWDWIMRHWCNSAGMRMPGGTGSGLWRR